jgi:DNA-binding HxlR family transcriptional regulator
LTERNDARALAVRNPNLILGSPVARALAVIGDRWAHLILRDAFLGVRRFEEFRRRSGAARGTLASRLKSLVESGILRRSRYQESPVRYEYRLTDKGLDLYPMVLAAWDWEQRWDPDNELPAELVHTKCRLRMQPCFQCRHCDRPLSIWDVAYRFADEEGLTLRIPARFQRRSRTRSGTHGDFNTGMFAILNVVGDRWTGLIVAAQFFGLHRYDDIGAALGIATNILASRLRLLVEAGVLRRVPYQKNPLRHEYRLTEKGADLYTHALQMHEWAGRWLLDSGEQPLVLTHKPCGKPLRSRVACSKCGEDLAATEVRVPDESATDRNHRSRQQSRDHE